MPEPSANGLPQVPDKAGYWDRKILAWETARYSPLSALNPASWTVRGRMAAAVRLVREEFARHPYVLDLGCGSGLLAQALAGASGRRYTGVDLSRVAVEAARARFAAEAGRIDFERLDVLEAPRWEAPLIVFLGLLDWLDEEEAGLLFSKLNAENLCFSFTEADSGAAGGLYRLYRRSVDDEYRPREFSAAQVTGLAEAAGYRVDSIRRLSWFDPGRLVTAFKK